MMKIFMNPRAMALGAVVLVGMWPMSSFAEDQTTQTNTTTTTQTTTTKAKPTGKAKTTKAKATAKAGPVSAAVQAERDRAAAKVEAAETRAAAKVDAAQAKVEATETRAKANQEAVETKAAARIEATELRSATNQEATKTKADADASSKSEATISASGRTSDRLGAYLSLWGDPYPAPVGVNVAYNVTDFARLNIGIGSNDDRNFTVSTIGVGAKALVPGWSLTPVLGINVSTTNDGGNTPRSVRGFNPAGARVYGTAGLDWQTGVGINLAAGYAQSFRGGEDGSFFLNAGFFL